MPTAVLACGEFSPPLLCLAVRDACPPVRSQLATHSLRHCRGFLCFFTEGFFWGSRGGHPLGVLRCLHRWPLLIKRWRPQALLFRLQPSSSDLNPGAVTDRSYVRKISAYRARRCSSPWRSAAPSKTTPSDFAQFLPARWETPGFFVMNPESQTFDDCKILDIVFWGSGVVIPWSAPGEARAV